MTPSVRTTLLAPALVLALLSSSATAALAAPASVHPVKGSYRGKQANGNTFKLAVGPCSETTTALCLYTPYGPGSENDLEEYCKGLAGATDGIDNFDELGATRIPANGKIKTKHTDTSFGNRETLSYTFVLTAHKTLTGTARLTASFPDGATCDSGTITLSAKH